MPAPRHILRRNHSSAMPARIVFVSCATDTRWVSPDVAAHELRDGYAIFWQRAGNKQRERYEERAFRRADAFWEWCEHRAVDGRRLVIVSHGGGFNVDVLGGPSALAARGWTVTKAVVDDGRTIIRAERAGASILVLDIENYFSLKVPATATAEEGARAVADAFGRWITFVTDLDLGHFAETLAKQAWNGYRHRFMDTPIFVHAIPQVAARERDAYYGGRCEVWQYGQLPDADYYKLDFNSAYAAVMSTALYPTKLIGSYPMIRLDALEQLLRRYLIVAEVEIETDVPIYPVRHDGRLAFPVGRFQTSLATPELVQAYKRGHLRDIGRASLYERAQLFTSWVAALYEARTAAKDAGDDLRAGWSKDCLTALYGRFGMRLARWQLAADEPGQADEAFQVFDADTEQTRRFRRIAGRLEEQGAEVDGGETFVAIPAHVTSYARVRLWRAMELAGLEHVYYVDTDSLIVDAAGYERLAPARSETELGKLKLEVASRDVELIGPKFYRVGSVSKHKGMSASAEMVDANRFVQTERIGRSERAGDLTDAGALTRLVMRSVGRGAPLGAIGADGRVTPLRIG